ncbi:MAG: PorT family protein [Saprospiraceae bacterium]|nr:PorT family protein [Saprospiraceae bacterium]
MKAQIPDHEKRLQDKILAHRVPFEEQAWDAMDALLEGEKGKKAPEEPPAPQETPTRSFKYRRFFILIFLFSAVAVFSAKLGLNMLENAKPKVTSTSPANHLKNGTQNDALSSGLTSATTAGENNVENQMTATGTLDAENTENKPTPATPQNGQKTNLTESRNTKTTSTVRKGTSNPDKGWAVGPAKQKSSVTGLNGGQTSLVANNAPADNKDAMPALPPNDAVAENNVPKQPENSTPSEQPKTLDNLDFLPLLPLDSLNKTRDLPKVDTVAVKNKIRRNLQRGWVFGGNLGFVDYQPFRLSLMPVVGYHVSLPVQKGFVQTGVQVTGATGYNQKTEFIYSAPGGSLDIDVSLKNLMFIEVPLVYQRAFTGNKRQFWLAGIRTAVVVPVDNYVSNAGSTNSNDLFPYANIDLYDGLRWFDLGLTVGWQWRFTDRWAMDVRYTQGLMDLTHDNFFNNTETTLNSDFQLTFRHYVNTFK